jgi:hypothetical protein
MVKTLIKKGTSVRTITGGGNSGGMHSQMTCIAILPKHAKSQTGRIYSSNGIARTMCSGTGGLGKNTGLYSIHKRVRRLTPLECEKLQGFPTNFTKHGVDENGNVIKISDTQRYKCLGNAVTVPVVQYVLEKISTTKVKKCDFIKCGSPLGEYEIHCTEEQKNQILDWQYLFDGFNDDGWLDIIRYVQELKIRCGKANGQNILLQDENKQLKEKAKKYDKWQSQLTKLHSESKLSYFEMLQVIQENKQLKEKLEKIKEIALVKQYISYENWLKIKQFLGESPK